MLATICAVSAIAGRTVVDSAQRRVEVPDRIERVVAAGPPASVLMTILAPEKMVGWNRTPLPEDLPYLPPVVRNLPEIGRLTGRGGTANLEVVMAAKPDLIVDFGSVSDTYISLADRVRNQTGIPYILIDGRFANTLSAVQLLGSAAVKTPGKVTMKLSARNILKGKIVEVKKGQTTAHVRIDVGGSIVTSSITNEAVDELKLAAGQSAYAVIKASDVMIAID